MAIVRIGEQLVTATVDTGATKCFVSEAFASTISAHREPDNTLVTLADGSRRQVTSAILTTISIGSLRTTTRLLVMPDATEDVILGLDFLAQCKASINCAGLSCELQTAKDATLTSVQYVSNFHLTISPGPSNMELTEPQDDTITNEVTILPGHSPVSELSAENQQVIRAFIETELQKFRELHGPSTAATHRIVMTDDRPFKLRYAARNPAMQAIIDAKINELLASGYIEPSHSAYSSPITLAQKKNGSWRLCMDFRHLNSKSDPDAYPLPRITTILDRLREATYVSSLDLKDGYWQIPMEEGSRKYTAFTVAGRGLYQWRVMPFGLHSAPATFQRALDSVIGPELEPYAFAYLDDIIVIGKTLDDHLANLGEVLRRLRAANLKINPEKCEFFKRETKYLGHVVSGQGIHTDPDKVAAIQEMPAPLCLKELRRFLGVVSWYRRFISDFASLAHPLTYLLKKGKHWRWTEEQQTVFELLKAKLTTAPVLACPDFTKTFILQTDASDYGLGAVLTQELEDGERVIAYASRTLNGAEKNYSATEKECLAIVWGIRKMRPYLEGYRFRVITDHLSLKWLNTIDNPTGRLARWALELQQHNFTVQYRKGKNNVVADALSRQPLESLQRVIADSLDTCTWLQGKIQQVQQQPQKFADYTIVGTQLFRHIPRHPNDEDCTPWKLCVASHLRGRVLHENHSQPAAGHLGIRKTVNRVCNRYYWPGMMRDIAKFVRSCESCQQYKPSQVAPAGEMLVTIPEEPWATVCTDFVGPLPRTKHGNNMLLVFFDRFSKWIELIPLRKATAESVVKSFRERILARFGTPKVLISDNGSQFSSRILKKYLAEIGVHHQFTAPYCPQENPTERANRTIKTMIAQIAKNQHNKWDEHLPEISLALNTSTSESTGYSPAYLVQCREPRLPAALYDELVQGTGASNHSPASKAQELQEIFKIVRHQLGRAAEDQRRHYNLRRRPWKPKIGDLVLIHLHPLSKAVDNFAAKLAPKFDGPYEVVEFTSPVIVRVRGRKKDDMRTAHLSEIKPYVESTSANTNLLHLNTLPTEQSFFPSTDTPKSSSPLHFSSNNNTRSEIQPAKSDTMAHTKAYYKAQWLEHEDQPRVRLTRVPVKADNLPQPVMTMPACVVKLERLEVKNVQPKKWLQEEENHPPPSPVTELIEISSESDLELTPPRKRARPGSIPPTPSPTVSPISQPRTPTRRHSTSSSSNASLCSPVSVSSTSSSSSSTSSSVSSTSSSSNSSSSSSSSASTVGDSGGRPESDGESKAERINVRLEVTRVSFTPPRPPKPTEVSLRPMEPPEVPTQTTTRATSLICGRPYQCYKDLSEAVRLQLEPCVAEAHRVRQGRNRYAKVVTIGGRNYRIVVSRQGMVTIQPR